MGGRLKVWVAEQRSELKAFEIPRPKAKELYCVDTWGWGGVGVAKEGSAGG